MADPANPNVAPERFQIVKELLLRPAWETGDIESIVSVVSNFVEYLNWENRAMEGWTPKLKREDLRLCVRMGYLLGVAHEKNISHEEIFALIEAEVRKANST